MSSLYISVKASEAAMQQLKKELAEEVAKILKADDNAENVGGYSFTAQDNLFMAIEEYAARHKGRMPEKIFVSEEMYSDLAHESSTLILYRDETPNSRFCGVPLVRYGSTGTAEFYLSDKEAI